MNIFKLLKENLNIAVDNFEASNRNANIEYAYRILSRAEIARFNAHTVQLTKGFLTSNYTAREIKLQEINFNYFTEEEKHVLLRMLLFPLLLKLIFHLNIFAVLFLLNQLLYIQYYLFVNI